ncbi:MAG: metallophosphatase family protein [Treponema sp.]|jgi:diadenosine tetraphosphatase ApaH/serine/threonine PP2A family protein phosphatase|nr:metallophosphatase family protein [Treponema sp.]
MRVLVVSDIHANLAAFDAVLRQTQADRDAVFCLGDLAGYGPDPKECIARAAETCTVVLGGNHDLALGGVADLSNFADHARRALEWTRPQLSPEEVAYLSKLPLKTEYGDVLLSHGSPENPLWGYIFSQSDAEIAFAQGGFTRCFFGHTHFPSFFIEVQEAQGTVSYKIGYGMPDSIIETDRENRRVLLNPGSIGFPRDQVDTPRFSTYHRAAARYALFDTESGLWQFKRLEYDMRKTAERMKWLGLW